METVTNIVIGFFISWGVLELIVAPLYGIQTSAADGFWITTIFTVSSLIRQYVLRRAFNGRTVWTAIKEAVA